MTDEKTFLLDCHAHTSGISPCCKKTPEEVIIAAKNIGIDGLVLTNHFSVYYVNVSGVYPDVETMIQKYMEEYRYTKEIGERYGVRVFFGIEVSSEPYAPVHLLLYGVEEDFLERHPDICYYTQEETYRAVHEDGGALVQAHPLRRGKNRLLDPKFLDGVEISSHIYYDGTHYEELSAFAKEHGIILTSGGDYHGDTSRSFCGMYLPESIKDTKNLAKYLLNADTVRLRMQEAEGSESYEKTFVRNKGDKK